MFFTPFPFIRHVQSPCDNKFINGGLDLGLAQYGALRWLVCPPTPFRPLEGENAYV